MIRIEQLSRIYRSKQGVIRALDRIDLHIREGEFVVVRGPSGCGKTTLLLTLGGMLRPSEGTVSVAGVDIYSLSPSERAVFRAENIGFVFQMFHLIPYLSVAENVYVAAGALPKQRDYMSRVKELLSDLGLGDRRQHKPHELSAGEKQRTALARALLRKPRILLADEPTGNLDPENALQVFRYMEGFHREGGTVVVVTHGTMADEFSDRIVFMRAGSLAKDPQPGDSFPAAVGKRNQI